MTQLVRVARMLIWCCEHGDVLGWDRPLVRFVGDRLHQLGGLEAMQDAYEEVVLPIARRQGDGPDVVCFEIQAAWDGIGDWQW
jgi:hypothetical protein